MGMWRGCRTGFDNWGTEVFVGRRWDAGEGSRRVSLSRKAADLHLTTSKSASYISPTLSS
jgi:hypothetical protein